MQQPDDTITREDIDQLISYLTSTHTLAARLLTLAIDLRETIQKQQKANHIDEG